MYNVTFDLTRHHIPSKAFIHGEWSESKGDCHILTSAVNDQTICKAMRWADERDVESAVESTAKGLQAWQALSKRERRDALVRYANLIRDNAETIFWLEAILIGKTRAFSNFEVDSAAEAFIYYANSIDTFHGSLLTHEDDCIKYTIHQPYGICAAIVPFNGPIVCYSLKAAPALAAGNALIVKASELNPLSTLFIVSLATQAGIPPGVINCIVGDGIAGNALAAHMRVRKISFTGSLAVARHIQVAAATSNLKSVTLELGGKSPTIVFPDADLNKAAEHCCQFLMLNGQGCMLGTRVYLHETIFDVVMPKIEATVAAYRQNLGQNPLDEDTWSSPMFNERQRENVLRYMEAAKKEATLVSGGSISIGEKGYYVDPAIFTHPIPDAKTLKEEAFGPVLVVQSFNDDAEVIRLANDSEYALGAYVWTGDIGRAIRTASSLEAGVVGVNGVAHAPWETNTTMGGWKQSGQGVENGMSALLDWTQVKSVKIQA